METEIPEEMLDSEYRRKMWKESRKVIEKLEKELPISSAYVIGSFTTKKERPADVDFIILLKTDTKDSDENWSADIVIAPDNRYGKDILDDADKWVKEKYGLEKSTMIRIK